MTDDVELEAHDGPTLEEGMQIVEWLEKQGGVPEELPEPYRAEYARRIK